MSSDNGNGLPARRPQPRENLDALSLRLDLLSERADQAFDLASTAMAQAHAWQQEHDRKSAQLLDMAEEIRALVEAMRWAATTRRLVLLIGGTIAGLAAAGLWLHETLNTFLSHRGP